jgi:hypothetical protein
VSEAPRNQTAGTPTRPAGDYEYVPPPARPTSAWGGWVTFAGIVLALIGVVHITSGLVALLDPGNYRVSSNGLVFSIDYTAWGWLHLCLGVAVLLTGVGVLNRRPWARITGVGFCALSILVNLGFVAAAPGWAVTVITLDVLFIYGISVHGEERD